MGAITFSIDPHLVQALTEATTFDCFVETGTYQGETIERVRPYVPEIISIEQAESYYRAVVKRFEDDEDITLIHGDSAETLAALQAQLEGQAILFWLDAHWCAGEQTAGVTSQCPLLRELAALGSLHPGSVVLIDDARYFLAPPNQPHEVDQWPTFEEVVQRLRALSEDHELMVVNDMLVFHPPTLREVVRTFALSHGVDWLGMVDRSREHDRLLQEMQEKEAAIKEIHAAAQERLARIQAFEKEQAHTENLLQATDRALKEQERTVESKDAIIASQQETMATREEVIASLQRELAAQQEIVQSLHDLQVALEGKVAARDELAQSKEEVLATSLERVHEKEAALQAREQAIEARADELLAQRAAVAATEAALTGREKQLAAAEEALSTRDEALQAKAEALTAHEEQLASQQAGIEAKEKVIATLKEKLAQNEVVIQGLGREMAVQQDLVESLRTIIGTHKRAFATKERELAAKDELLAYKEQEVEEKEQQIQTQHRELIEKEAVIHQLDRFRRTSLRYWFSHRLGGLLRRLLGAPLRPARALLRPRLGTLEQHAPRPLNVPQRYHATRCTVAEPPTISVVTPAYNHAEYLERTIESVLGQPYDNLEYIIQDGGSTDGTGAILDRYRSQCAHVASQPDRGQAHAINLGFAHATGEIMAWLNSDDLLLPGALPFVANYFARHPEVDVVYGHRILIDEDDQEIGRWILPTHDEDILNWADYIPQETMFWRRRIWEAAGGQVDESFQFALDWELLLRFQEAGAQMVCLPRFLGAFRVYAAQKTMDWADVGEAEMARLRERAHGKPVSWPEINAQVDPYVRRAVHRHLLYRAGLLRL